MSAPNVSSEMVDAWVSSRGVIAEIAATQNPDLCFVCQERTYFTKVCGVGICRPCDEGGGEE
jgi:hypothetical protein